MAHYILIETVEVLKEIVQNTLYPVRYLLLNINIYKIDLKK